MLINTTKTILKLPDSAIAVIGYFKKHGFECYVVGGYIRDMLLKRELNEHKIDFATNAKPEQMLKLFPNAKYENRFGTVLLPLHTAGKILNIQKYSPSACFEITTYRSESLYVDHRHPNKVVWGKSIIEDVKRRDFTINALAYNGSKLIDEFGGLDDIKHRTIKCVGNPFDRFKEDALRMMRAIRFASQLDFTIEKNTLEAIVKYAPTLKKISMERIRDEFLYILSSQRPVQGVELLRYTNLLKIFLPEIYPAFECGQKSIKRHHIYDVGTHLIKSLASCTNPNPITRLAVLLHDIGKPATRTVQKNNVVTFYNHEIVGTQMAYDIGKRLKLSKKDLVLLTKLVRYHQFTTDENQSDSAVRRTIRNIGKEYINDLLDLRTADRIGSGAKPSSWRFELFKKRVKKLQKKPFTVHDLAITGKDVMEEKKLSQGPVVGQILNKLFKSVVEKGLPNTKSALMRELKLISIRTNTLAQRQKRHR